MGIEVFDALGRRVMTVPAERMVAGAGRTLPVDASQLASGLYVYRITAEGIATTQTAMGRFVVIK